MKLFSEQSQLKRCINPSRKYQLENPLDQMASLQFSSTFTGLWFRKKYGSWLKMCAFLRESFQLSTLRSSLSFLRRRGLIIPSSFGLLLYVTSSTR
jgi:hypothetical protein